MRKYYSNVYMIISQERQKSRLISCYMGTFVMRGCDYIIFQSS